MRTLYELAGLPTFQNRTFARKAEAVACDKGDMRLVQDDATGLIYNAAFDPDLMVYDADYQNFQAISPGFRDHLTAIAGIVQTHLHSPLIEVGCGKAYFFDLLASRGMDIVGCDPSYEGANPRIIKKYYSAALGFQQRSGIVLRHVLEHIQDPFAFLSGLRDANNGGMIYIEVPCFDWILDHRAWFDIFYEHVNYFRMDDFRRLFGRLLFAERTFGGQYLSIVGDLSTLRAPTATDEVTIPPDFAPNVDRYESGAGIWGAASKGVIFSLLLQRAGKAPSVAIDINPQKHGQFLPASGQLVSKPEDGLAFLPPGSTIYVMNGNYLAEIQAMAPAHRCVAIDA